MAITRNGSRISFSATNDRINLNCPIKKIQYVAGTPANLVIDGYNFYLNSGHTLEFNSLNGYPGVYLQVTEITQPFVINISEIGDVLNPNYFNEDIRNWNGQGATAVAQASEAEAAPTAAKASRSKKAEVTE